MAHFGLNLRLPSYVLRQQLRGVLRSLRIFLALAFEVLAGILLAVNAVWDALLMYVVWRCILFVQASHRCSPESTRGLKKNGEQKRFRASAEEALESLSDENAALCRWSKETAIALHKRSYPLCPTVQLLAANACGYGLDVISHSSATTSCASSNFRLPAISFPLNSNGELATHTRDGFRLEDCASELYDLSSLLQLSVENITPLPTSPSTFALLNSEGTRFDAVQLSIPQRICDSLQSISGQLPHCVMTTYPSQSNEARLDATSMSGWEMHKGVLEADLQLIVVKDPACSVMGGVHMNWWAGILSISRYDGVVRTRNLNKWMSVTVISSFQPKSIDKRFPAMAKLALQKSFRGSRTRRPARWTRALEENFDKIELQSHCSQGDSFKSLYISVILRAPPMPAVKCIEVVDSKQQACKSLSAAETLQKIGEKNEQELPLPQTWWDEDAVLLGEETCEGFEQWKPLPKCRKKSLFSVCKSAMTFLASSLSSKSTQYPIQQV